MEGRELRVGRTQVTDSDLFQPVVSKNLTYLTKKMGRLFVISHLG